MYETKLISVRVDVDTLAKIDKIAESSRYWTRSSYIQRALDIAAWMCENDKELKLMYFNPRWDTVDKFEFEYHRKPR